MTKLLPPVSEMEFNRKSVSVAASRLLSALAMTTSKGLVLELLMAGQVLTPSILKLLSDRN
jgi:hypothetical protein